MDLVIVEKRVYILEDITRVLKEKNWNYMQIYIDTKEVHTGSLDDDGVSDFLYDLIKKDIIVKEELKYCQMKFINNEKRELSYV